MKKTIEAADLLCDEESAVEIDDREKDLLMGMQTVEPPRILKR